MPQIKIINSNLKAIQLPPAGQRFYWDTELKGFGIKATPSGLIYVVQRRVNGRTVRHIVGKHGEITPKQARDKAAAELADLREGIDLNAAKAKVKHELTTLSQVYEEFKQSRELRPKTIQVYDSVMRRCFSDWLDRPIISLSKDMAEKQYKKIANANGPRGKGDAQASQAMRVLGCLINYAMDILTDSDGKPLIAENPVKCLNRIKQGWRKVPVRQDIIADHDLKSWYQAVVKLGNDTSRDYLLLCLFTGLRRSEAAKLTWENVDSKARTIRIPAEDTKTNEEHRLPLSDFLYELLSRRAAVRAVHNPYVFPGRDGQGHLREPKTAVRRVTTLSGVKFRIHDLRRTFETIAERLDISHYALKRLLNHKAGDITARYIVTQVERLKEPMQRISDYLKKQIGITDGDLSQASSYGSRQQKLEGSSEVIA